MNVGVVGELLKKVGIEDRIGRKLIQGAMGLAQFTVNERGVKWFRGMRVRGPRVWEF